MALRFSGISSAKMDIKPAREIAISRVSFNDIDLFSEWVNTQGWDIESTQLSAGANELRYDHVACPELVVSHYCTQQSKQSLFALPDGMVLFVIGRAKLPLFWCGRHLPPTLLGIARVTSRDIRVVGERFIPRL